MDHFGTVDFETQRLICRKFHKGDAEDMLKNWVADPDIQHEYGEPVYTDISQAEGLLSKYIEGYNDSAFYRWAIIEKKSGQNIGQIALCKVWSDVRAAEIEYCISKSCWGNGYAGEALTGLIGHIFSYTEFERLEAYHRAENTKSGRVLQKSGMHITDTVERFKRENKSPAGEVCYCITRSDLI